MNTVRALAIRAMTLGLSFATQSFAQTFTYTQIDVPNSSLTRPFGINSVGQIVGLSRDGDGTPHGFLRYTDGTYLKFEYPGAIFTNAMSINDQGQIIGRWVDTRPRRMRELTPLQRRFARQTPLFGAWLRRALPRCHPRAGDLRESLVLSGASWCQLQRAPSASD